MWTLSLSLLCWTHAGLLISAQPEEADTPSSVPTPISFEPTPVYYYNPPNSNINYYAPRRQEEESPATYFGPAIGIALVFTFIFVHYWRKHRNDEENEALFLDEEEFLPEELSIEGGGRGSTAVRREVALTNLDNYNVCKDNGVDEDDDDEDDDDDDDEDYLEDEDYADNNNLTTNPIRHSQSDVY